jgi:hypothetical protein
MKRQSKPKSAAGKLEPVTLFRHWLGGRISGRIEGDHPGTDESAGMAFPEQAWAVYSFLAEQGAEKLEDELCRAFSILFRDLDRLAWNFSRLLSRGKTPRLAEKFLTALDESLPVMKQGLGSLLRFRALETKSSELLLEAGMRAKGHPHEAEYFMRRYYALEPDEEAEDAKGEGYFAFMMEMACDAVEVLERLQEKYPAAARWAARYRDRWPVLHRRGERGNAAFRELAARIQLGADYALDPDAKVHTARKHSLRSYLTPLLEWLVPVHANLFSTAQSQRLESAAQLMRKRGHPLLLPCEPCPPGAAQVLAEAAELSPLRKGTAVVWADKLVVPFIMATDAANVKDLSEPALIAIWKQGRVKSPNTFRSRLLDAVRRELPRMARK